MTEAFLITIELWVFLGILLTALVIEAIITTYKQHNGAKHYDNSRTD
jgi:hypothetical protein